MDARDLLLSTDYPIDQVIWRSGISSYTIPAFGFDFFQIPHTVGRLFLPILQFSTSSTFQNVYPENGGPWANGQAMYQVALTLDSTKLEINIINRTASSVTLYFRCIGLACTNRTYISPYTNVYQDLLIDTDLNYMKLYDSGIINVPINQTRTVNHNLGYIPTVMAWAENSTFNTISPVTYTDLDLAGSGGVNTIELNNTQLILGSGFSAADYHYRIYVDG